MLLLPVRYAYLFITLPFCLLWLFFYIFSKRTRKIQLKMSIFLFPVGIFSELMYFKDYWRPDSIFSISIGSLHILLEDILFGFAVSSISTVLYIVISKKHLQKCSQSLTNKLNLLTIVLIFFALSFLLFTLKINSIYATSLGMIVTSLSIFAKRKDLLLPSLANGVLFLITVALGYTILLHTIGNIEQILKNIWLLYQTQLGIRIFGLPITEMVWAYSFGLFSFPLYFYLNDIELI